MIDERLMFYFYFHRSLEIANDIFSNIGSEINELAGDVTELQVGMLYIHRWLNTEYLWVRREIWCPRFFFF